MRFTAVFSGCGASDDLSDAAVGGGHERHSDILYPAQTASGAMLGAENWVPPGTPGGTLVHMFGVRQGASVCHQQARGHRPDENIEDQPDVPRSEDAASDISLGQQKRQRRPRPRPLEAKTDTS